jgi:hypothetical protein
MTDIPATIKGTTSEKSRFVVTGVILESDGMLDNCPSQPGYALV